MNLGSSITSGLQQWLHIFRDQATAGWLVLFMAVGCLILCVSYYFSSVAPAIRALRHAQSRLDSVTFAATSEKIDVQAERETQLDEVVARVAGQSATGRRIKLAWRRRLAAVKSGAVRGEEALLKPANVLGPNPRWLGVAADTFVGVGLIFTFMGLVAALGSAAETIATGADNSQAALLGLLGAASVKFFTSIAGIGGAVVMRVWQAFWLSRIGTLTAEVSDSIDMHLYGT